jgi:hypothetical protein
MARLFRIQMKRKSLAVIHRLWHDIVPISGRPVDSCIGMYRDRSSVTSPAGDAASPARDVFASPNCGICDTAGDMPFLKYRRFSLDIHILAILHSTILNFSLHRTFHVGKVESIIFQGNVSKTSTRDENVAIIRR